MRGQTTGSRDVRYRFGEFELDVGSYTLTRSGDVVHLTPKVFDLLRHLVEHRGRVVTKDELLDTVWAGSQVSEGAVPWAINHVRTALGQRSREKAPIETVYGRGYRFVAETQRLEAAAPEPSVSRRYQPPGWVAPPFIGREQALSLLGARLAGARRGAGGVCTLVGPAGIGKTRCLEELAASARDAGFSVWSGRSTEDTIAPVFWPWTQVLQQVVGERPELEATAGALLERLEAGEPGDAEQLRDASPAASFWFFEGVSALLRDAARAAPVLLLLDDLHWADAGSIRLLSFVAPELSRLAVFVVSAQRDGRPARRRDLRRLWRHADRIELEPLTPLEVGRYLAAVSARDAGDVEPPAELCEALHRATAGNPLLLSQTVRALLAEHGAEALGSLAPTQIEPVKSARDILRHALESLDVQGRRALQVASVLGEEFDVSTLQAVCGLEPTALLAALEAAGEDGFVRFEPPNRYRFRHGLLRATLYDELTASERAHSHRRAAEALHPQRLGEIARHYYRSMALGDHARVAQAAEAAAAAAARLQAYADAATFTQWALEARTLDRDTQPRDHAKLLLRHARLQGLAGDPRGAHRSVAALEELARRHGFWDMLVRGARVLRPTHLLAGQAHTRACAMLEEALRKAPEGERRTRIGALSQLAWIPPYALDMERSKALSAEALDLARELDDPAALFEALHAQLYTQSGPDDVEALLGFADEIRARSGSSPNWMTMEALIASYGAHLYRGDLAAADATLATHRRVAREQRWPEPIWASARIAAQRRMLEGDFAAAERALLELRARAGQLNLGYGARLVDSLMAQLIATRDGPAAVARTWDVASAVSSIHDVMPGMRPGVARLCLESDGGQWARSVLETMVDDGALDVPPDVPKDLGYLNALSNLALLAVELGDTRRAERLYEALSPYPHHNTPSCTLLYDGSVSHGLAMLAALLGRKPRARAHFDDALQMNERLGMRAHVARTCYEYARFELASRRGPARGAGRDLGKRALELCDGLGMGWLGALARALD